MLKQLLKPLLANTMFRVGSIRRIWRGPCKGLRYRIFPEYGLSPLHGGWESEAQAIMVKHIGPSAVVYDVGANFGIHTLLMARLATAGKVYAFEPMPEINSALRENVALNGFANVVCVEVALSDRRGRADFARGHHGGAGHLQDGGNQHGRVYSVETESIDEFVYSAGREQPTFIKVDVEGAESRVLKGAARVLREVRPIILLDLHTPEQDVAVGRMLAANRYEAFRTHDGSHVSDLTRGWPDQDGLWGQFVALPT